MRFLIILLLSQPILSKAQRTDPPQIAQEKWSPTAYIFPYQEGKFWGYRNAKKILIEAQYDYVDPVFGKFMVAMRDSLAGVINNEGKTVIPFTYQQLKSPDNQHSGFNWFLAQKNGRWGIIDQKGRVVEPFEWEEVEWWISNPYVLLSRKGLQRLINNAHQTITQTQYDSWFWRSGNFDRKKYIAAYKNGKIGLTDYRHHQLLPFEFYWIAWVDGNYACAAIDKYNSGIYKLPGKEILPPKYMTILQKDDNHLYQVRLTETKLWGMVDSSGKFVLPSEYEGCGTLYQTGLMQAKKPGGKYALFSASGKQLTEPNYEMFLFKSGVKSMVFGRIATDQWRLINAKGAYVSQDTFESVQVSDMAFTATKKGKMALFSLEGKRLTDHKYNYIACFTDDSDRQYHIRNYKLPANRTWVASFYDETGLRLYLDSEGEEYNPFK